ncbi:MAG: tryptophan 7-halogenase [Pseudomonadota bacterium]
MSYDVIILGGGLAGLCLARQLARQNQALSILILERNQYPYPHAAHKVGEATTELGSHYLRETLQLKEYLENEHFLKAGLRFFFSHGDNTCIEKRFEFGSCMLPEASSYQIDRGKFENYLATSNQAMGIKILDNVTVLKVDLGKNNASHQVIAEHQNEEITFSTRWLIDATGRRGLIKRQEKLSQQNNHNANAVWLRIHEKIDIDDWFPKHFEHPAVPRGLRYYSTNHLMGTGYWLWLIPLSSGSTSIGLVFDEKIYAFTQLNSFEKLMAWLEKHEPQCANAIKTHQNKLQDFHVLKNFSYSCQQVYSEDRWCLTGEAGAFLDPLYSPGTDFIGISNTLITQMILADYQGEEISTLAQQSQNLYFQLYNASLALYQDIYPFMGDGLYMLQKIYWDYASYWGITAFLFSQNKLCDFKFLRRIKSLFIQIHELNKKVNENLAQGKVFIPSNDNNFFNTSAMEITPLQKRLVMKMTDNEIMLSIKGNIKQLGSMVKAMKQEVIHENSN